MKFFSTSDERPAIFPLVILVGAVSISMASILIKLCPEVPSLVIAVFRTGVVSLILLPIVLVKKEIYPFKLLMLSLLAGLGLALHFGFWISSLKYTSVASSLFVLSVYPFLVAIASHFFLREKLTLRFTIGMLLTLIGIGIIFSFDLTSLTLTLGNFLSFLGALSLVLYFVPGRVVRKRVHIIQFLFVVYSTATVFLLLAVWIGGYGFTGYKTSSYVYMFLLAIVSQGLGHSSFNWALRYVKAGLISMTTLVEPIGATILAWIFLGEVPGLAKIAGGILVILGIVLAWFREK